MATGAPPFTDPAAPLLQHASQLGELSLFDRRPIRLHLQPNRGQHKTRESDYAKYIKEADNNRDFVEEQIKKSATQMKPSAEIDIASLPQKHKSPWFPKGLSLERVIGVEPTTLCLASIRSSQLSYTRDEIFLPEPRQFVNFTAAN